MEYKQVLGSQRYLPLNDVARAAQNLSLQEPLVSPLKNTPCVTRLAPLLDFSELLDRLHDENWSVQGLKTKKMDFDVMNRFIGRGEVEMDGVVQFGHLMLCENWELRASVVEVSLTGQPTRGCAAWESSRAEWTSWSERREREVLVAGRFSEVDGFLSCSRLACVRSNVRVCLATDAGTRKVSLAPFPSRRIQEAETVLTPQRRLSSLPGRKYRRRQQVILLPSQFA